MQIKEFKKLKNLDSLLKAYQDEELPLQKKQKPTSLKSVITFFEILRILFWVLIIGAVLFLIYRLFLSEKGLFSAPMRNKHQLEEEEDIRDDDLLQRRISEAEREGNYRLAVRYQFLQALNTLARRSWINLSPDKTNYQYLRELSGKPIRNDFARIALHYEYAWYGNFDVNSDIYHTIKKEFSSFQLKLK